MNTNPNIENSNEQNQTSTIDSLTQERATESNAIQIPQISLPKGGGALKGIDEKFEVNSANGTAGFSIPLPITLGRNGFSPSLALSYNSGGGNSPYGLGWSVGYPMIQRKTDKKLPRYRDGLDEDTFMFSGVEDLVPFLKADGSLMEKVVDGYTVKRYRPRIEGGFARIERINHASHGVFWKVTTGENIATIFGRSKNARIANPEDDTQIYQWMPEFSYDDKGNWIKYEYKKEDLVNVPNELYEKNRIEGIAPFTNTYLKRIRYGNRKAYYAYRDANDKAFDPRVPEDSEHFFEMVMDYGEHDNSTPTPQDNGQWNYRPDAFSSYRSGFEIRTNRLCERILMFHHFKDEKQFVGTPEEEDFGENYLVRSLDLEYEPSSINESEQSETTYLKSITQTGYIRKPKIQDGSFEYSPKSLPPMEFTYENLNWNKTIKKLSPENVVNAPVGLTNNYQWVDLYGEGISGILTEQGEGWYYKSNLGDVDEDGEVTFTVAQKVIPKPSFTGLSNGVLSLQDLAANGEKQIVVNSPGVKGYFELTHDNDWKPFQAFEQIANINLQDPNTRLIDLNGDGQPELVMTEENVFVWYAADGKRGHLPVERTLKTFNEEQGPAIVFADQEQTIFLADMAGDGLTDIVRIRNGEICYWANKGYGKFSAKVSMGNAPLFDAPDLFNPQYLHLADVSGTGATDIIYLGKNTFRAFINLSGNAWSDAHEIDPFFAIDSNSKLSVIDLLGTGTSCLVWSSDLPAYANAPMRYIDLMDSKKPHVLTHYKNNLGKETSIHYKSSTHYYLQDKLAGKPWITKLPFAVQVVSKMIIEEKITDVQFASEYRYHHGYYDHPEREFRGFGMVEQIDSEHYEEWRLKNEENQLEKSEELYQKPVLTKTWFHTGAFLDRERILTHFKDEYWYEEYNRQFSLSPLNITEPELLDAQLSDDIKALVGDEYREALRACKGMMLRQEVFALDAPDNPTDVELQLQLKPYTVATHNCNIQLLQPRANNQYGVFIVTESEAINISYERDETDYRIAHTLNTKIDELGNILESASVVYGRQQAKADADFKLLSDNITDFSKDVLNNDPAQMAQLKNAFSYNIQVAKDEQTKTHIIYIQNSFAKYNDGTTNFDDIDLPHAYRLRLPYEAKTYELTNFPKADLIRPSGLEIDLYRLVDLEDALAHATEIGYHEIAAGPTKSRLIEHVKIKYLADGLTALDFGYFDILGLPYESYQLAYTPELVTSIYSKQDGTELQVEGRDVSTIIKAKGNYTEFNNDGLLWIRSGLIHFKENAAEAIANVHSRFFSPLAFEDPFGAVTSVVYDTETIIEGTRNNDGYYLFVKTTTDAIENKVEIDIFNYRTLSPSRMIDVNANPSSVITDELGLVKALAVEGNGNFDGTNYTLAEADRADDLVGLKEYTDDAEKLFISNYFGSPSASQLKENGDKLLQHASARFVYDFDAYKNDGKPTVVSSISREEHFAINNNSNTQISFEYSDGLGNVAMAKVQAEPGIATQATLHTDGAYTFREVDTRNKKTPASSPAPPMDANAEPELRWIGNGRTILNNKGNPVKQYEPYFSTNFLYEDAAELVERGVTPILHYDSLSRMIKTVFPDGTLARVEFDSWKQINFDQNDTVAESECLWYLRRTDNARPDFINDEKEHIAAQKALAHSDTPSSLFLDSLGRPVLSVDHNGKDALDKDRLYTTFINLDIEGNARSVIDARSENSDGTRNPVVSYKYNMLGHRIYENSMDSGERWMLNNLMGNPIITWDAKGQVFTTEYDFIQRPIHIRLGTAIINKINYGENLTDNFKNNLRGQVYELYDSSGVMRSDSIDFKGNTLSTSRQFPATYDAEVIDWSPGSPTNQLESESFIKDTEYDALNRMQRLYNWYRSADEVSVYLPSYNARGVLESEKQIIGADISDIHNTIGNVEVVSNIEYNEKGQRTRMKYGNGTNTRYHYDKETFRLIQLKTTRNETNNSLPSNLSDPNVLQNLYYTYDPVGNITEIEDDAFEPVFFKNQRVEPRSKYTYDASYRLLAAEGRENKNFNTAPQANESSADDAHFPITSTGESDKTLRNYTQIYTYDPVGNILQMRHQSLLDNNRWTRSYSYATDNNRLLRTWKGSDEINAVNYRYDEHGSMLNYINTPTNRNIKWDYNDMIQQVNLDGGGTAYYQYDGQKERSRKRIIKGNITEERLYLGGMEIYRRWRGANLLEEIETLHVFVDDQRILMVEDISSTDDRELTADTLYRYQYSNHLGSVGLELDKEASIISYEEYHPYGTVAYQATNSAIKTKTKRYRYTGMERDEESGLSYHSARYYLPWLGRWLSADPIGIEGGINLYSNVHQNPIKFLDSTGTQANSSVSTDSENFVDFESFKSANPTQPHEVLWEVWAESQNMTPVSIKPEPKTHRRKGPDTEVLVAARQLAQLHASVEFQVGAMEGREAYHIPLRERLRLMGEDRLAKLGYESLAELDVHTHRWRSRVMESGAFKDWSREPGFAIAFGKSYRYEIARLRKTEEASEVLEITSLLVLSQTRRTPQSRSISPRQNFTPGRADSLAAALKLKYGGNVTVMKNGRPVFRVHAGGTHGSKHATITTFRQRTNPHSGRQFNQPSKKVTAFDKETFGILEKAEHGQGGYSIKTKGSR